MILTVTVNAAVDKTLTVANLQLGHRHRAQQGLVMAGGKGVNVARALKRLGEPVIATGLAGGHNGARILDEMTAEGILNDFVRIRGRVADVDRGRRPDLGVQTEVYEYGPEVIEEELDAARREAPLPVRAPSRRSCSPGACRARCRPRSTPTWCAT